MIYLEAMTDGHLLKEFIEKRDQRAFATLVERHAKMVLAVCRGILGDDAEDAAQATFVALSKKASSLYGELSVGAWLHRVARCVSVDAYRSNKARLERERKVIEMTDTTSRDDSGRDEVLALVTSELDSLPEKYRRALILFHMENASLESAARLLACPLKTVGTRLLRGREMLRKRLMRHGVAASGAAIGILLSTDAGAATIPSGFVSATTQAAVLCAAGKATAFTGGVSAKVLAMAESALKTIFYAQVKLLAIAVASFGLLGASGVAAYKAINAAGTTRPYAQWNCKMKISFNGYNKYEPLTNFPTLVILNPNLSNFSYTQFASSNGFDLRFADSTTANELNYEVEQWNTNGLSYVWVQVPVLSNEGFIWAYWGNSSVTQRPYCTTNGAVWPTNNFAGVWHMAQSNALDSTANRNNGTAVFCISSVSNATGIVGNAQVFSGCYVKVPDSPSLDFTSGAATISGWIRFNTLPGWEQAIVRKQNHWQLGFASGTKTRNALTTTSPSGWTIYEDDTFIPSLTAGQWFYFAFTYVGSKGKQWNFENGRSIGSSPHAIGATIVPTKSDLWLGGGFDQALSDAVIDEVRVERVFRSSNWLWASYMTVVSNSVFSVYEMSK